MQEFDKEVGVSFRSGKLRSRSCICLIILSVAVVLLLAVSVVFVTLYVLDKRSSASQSLPQSTARPGNTPYLPITQKPGEQKYCGSKACLLASLGRLPS